MCQKLRSTVPASMPGIFLLDGNTPLDLDKEESARTSANKWAHGWQGAAAFVLLRRLV